MSSTPVTDPALVVETSPGPSRPDGGDMVAVGPKSPSRGPRPKKRSFFERVEAFVSRLSSRNNFWHRVCSMIWLPYAFRSGIKMRRIDGKTFSATLPFTRFNKNWYNAMAGAALLGNSEIAGGMYVFGVCGGDYTVVCKHLEYRFLRPCFGPAEYRITPREDINALLATGGEFNITIDLDVVQTLPAMDQNRKNKRAAKSRKALPKFGEKRVGRSTATFHVTPKQHNKTKGR
jgi:hypothetical protein